MNKNMKTATVIPDFKNITNDEVKLILMNYGHLSEDLNIEDCTVYNDNEKMLGFLSDYYKLKVVIKINNDRKFLNFFIKVIPETNEAKATMVRELNLFEKEKTFYTVIKSLLDIPGIKPWSAKLALALDNAMVFQDLNALQYKLREKFKRFDIPHTLQALRTLSRFHASSIIYEENRSKELQRKYRMSEEYDQLFDRGGYTSLDIWVNQCMNGALEALKMFSKYRQNEELMKDIDIRWRNAWYSAMDLSGHSAKYRSIPCHSDLWNNNILFHYEKQDDVPDDCVFVDFAAVRCQPPASDIMLLLHCNLDPNLREANMEMFLNCYHEELASILYRNGLKIEDIFPKNEFFKSAEERRLWGIVVCACLLPQFWLDDDLTKSIFNDTAQFNDVMTKTKGNFIKKNMESNSEYRTKVMEIFEEILERYCLP